MLATVFAALSVRLPAEARITVRAMDITYIPMALGFICLGAVLDWFMRYVLAGGCRSRWNPTST